VTVAYTVRFRLDERTIQTIHTRFGTAGIWAAVRDESGRTLRQALADVRFGIDDLFGQARREMEADLSAAMTEGLVPSGLAVTMFNLGDLDLGRSGAVIQATIRARLELQREEAETAMRVTRARIDAELGAYIDNATSDAALRYREVDSWRDIAQLRSLGPAASQPSPPTPVGAATSETAIGRDQPDVAESDQ
jgi:hypothetical protein